MDYRDTIPKKKIFKKIFFATARNIWGMETDTDKDKGERWHYISTQKGNQGIWGSKI